MKKRPAHEVVGEIEKMVPSGRHELLRRLGVLRMDFVYRDPEQREMCMQLLGNELNKHLNWPPKLRWERRIERFMKGTRLGKMEYIAGSRNGDKEK